MSASWQTELTASGEPQSHAQELVPMMAQHLDAVMAIETSAYAFPWTRGNFSDSLKASHPAWVLSDQRSGMLGYWVGMASVDEMHLLNIAVAPAEHRRGHARQLMNALITLCRETQMHEIWLEVRTSNTHAHEMYVHFGFERIGLRKNYYPAPMNQREDALVMRLKLASNMKAAHAIA
jgi:[ribosomal protein S18]-alanine N-acetyltransferase